MAIRKFQDLSRGGNLSAADYNRLAAEVERQSIVTASPPLEIVSTGTGLNLRYIKPELFANITDRSSNVAQSNPIAYAWQEIVPDGEGNWSIVDGGKHGTLTVNPAYEINNTLLAVGTNVVLLPGVNNEYIIERCCSDTVTSSSSGSSSGSSNSSSNSGSGNSNTSNSSGTSNSSNSSNSLYPASCLTTCVPLYKPECVNGQLVLMVSYLRWLPEGFCVSDTPCDTSSSSSVSGSGVVTITPGACTDRKGNVRTNCCPNNTIPEQFLIGTFTSISSQCQGIPPLCFAFSNDRQMWIAVVNWLGQTDVEFTLQCLGQGQNGWLLASSVIGAGGLASATANCNPFMLTFTPVPLHGACEGSATLTITA